MTTLSDWLKKLSFSDQAFEADLRSTYFALRLWIGGIGGFLPIVLVGWGLSHGIAWKDMIAISAFYWLPSPEHPLLRDWFVGSLWAVGTGLIIYDGYSSLENWLLNFAGLTLVVVALNPMPWPPPQDTGLYLSVHGIASVIFFMLIAATIWFCAGDTLRNDSEAVRLRWLRIYKVLAIAIVAAPLVALLIGRHRHWTIWVEMLGIWIFSSYWFIKTYEVSSVSKLEPRDGPAPRLRWVGGELQIVKD